jgi:hypothetical protein
MFNTDEVDQFDYSRLYGNEKYSLQKMELKSASFPAQVEPGKATAVWSDRMPSEWEKAGDGIKSNQSGDAWWAGVSEKDLLIFAQRMADAIHFEHKVTGARITRYTNASSGYPCLVLELTSGGKGIRGPKMQRRSRYGYGKHGYDGPLGIFEDYGSDDK